LGLEKGLEMGKIAFFRLFNEFHHNANLVEFLYDRSKWCSGYRSRLLPPKLLSSIPGQYMDFTLIKRLRKLVGKTNLDKEIHVYRNPERDGLITQVEKFLIAFH
jgi:hypothetical protein